MSNPKSPTPKIALISELNSRFPFFESPTLASYHELNLNFPALTINKVWIAEADIIACTDCLSFKFLDSGLESSYGELSIPWESLILVKESWFKALWLGFRVDTSDSKYRIIMSLNPALQSIIKSQLDKKA